MPRRVEENIEVRNRVRQSMVLPVPVLPALDASEISDTSEDTLAKFRLAKIIPSARASAEADAAAGAKRRRSLDISEGTKEYVWTRGEALGSGSIRSLGILPDAGFIKAVVVNLNFDGGTGSGTFFFGVKVGAGEVAAGTILFGADYDRATQIWEQNFAEEPGLSDFQMSFPSAINRTLFRDLRLSFPVFGVPSHLIGRTLFLQAVAGTMTATISISVIYDTQPGGVSTSIFVPPIGRLSISPYSAGATPRSSRSTPRAAELSVTQGGRVLSTRVVAWESLAPNLRADWFNRQVGGTGDPNIRWIP